MALHFPWWLKPCDLPQEKRQEGCAQDWMWPRWLEAGALRARGLNFLSTWHKGEMKEYPWKAQRQPSRLYTSSKQASPWLWGAGPCPPSSWQMSLVTQVSKQGSQCPRRKHRGQPIGQEERKAGERGSSLWLRSQQATPHPPGTQPCTPVYWADQ